MKFTGTPLQGRGRARTLGFPTINLHNLTRADFEEGVYTAKAFIHHKTFKAVMHCGDAPTFKDKDKTVEIFLLDTPSISILPTDRVVVEIFEYLRPVMKFTNKTDLIEQIQQDVDKTDDLITLP